MNKIKVFLQKNQSTFFMSKMGMGDLPSYPQASYAAGV